MDSSLVVKSDFNQTHEITIWEQLLEACLGNENQEGARELRSLIERILSKTGTKVTPEELFSVFQSPLVFSLPETGMTFKIVLATVYSHDDTAPIQLFSEAMNGINVKFTYLLSNNMEPKPLRQYLFTFAGDVSDLAKIPAILKDVQLSLIAEAIGTTSGTLVSLQNF